MLNLLLTYLNWKGDLTMAVVKIIEILAESPVSWEAAAQEAVTEAAKTIRNIQTIYINNFQGIVKEDKIVNYRVDAKISFVVKE
jgi:dodecin